MNLTNVSGPWNGQMALRTAYWRRLTPPSPPRRDLIHSFGGVQVKIDAARWLWPWEHRWYKPTPEDRVRELTKAGALIAAAIDDLLRSEEAGH